VRVVLDADVLIGALDGNDPHHRQARALFRRWRRQDTSRLISVVNLTEALIAPAADRRRLRAAREAIAALGVEIHRPNEAIAVDAARLRGTYPISLPDAYCLATARDANGSLASFDERVLRAAERERVPPGATVVRLPRRH
jgi:predicted nucleic acid-binding protein